MKVALGGTFDPVHDGHRELLREAIRRSNGGEVMVGLTSDELAPKTRPEPRDVRPWEQRRENLREEIDRLLEEIDGDTGDEVDVEIRRLDDPFGIASEEEGFDVLVVSPETREGGEKINDLREERGFEPLEIVEVPHVMADDGDPISSTRVVKGEIDRHGNVLQDADA